MTNNIAIDNNHFNHLPNEILYKIFDYLSIKDQGSIAQVCKGWHAILQEDYFKRSINQVFLAKYLKKLEETIDKVVVEDRESRILNKPRLLNVFEFIRTLAENSYKNREELVLKTI